LTYRLGEGFDAVERALEAGLHPLEPERVPKALRDLGIRPLRLIFIVGNDYSTDDQATNSELRSERYMRAR